LSGIPTQLEFTRLGSVRVQAVFDEPELSSDGGALLLREAAEVNGILDAMVGAIRDDRDQAHVQHTLKELLTRRTVQICHGYEDANDCDTMRDDAVLKIAAGRGPEDGALASQPTMTRLENSVGKRDLIMFRADSHHTKPDVMDWLEANDVRYVTGMATNAVLRREVQPMVERAAAITREEMGRFRCFHSFNYQAGSWSRSRRIVARIESAGLGTDVRFIVTDLERVGAKFLYDRFYCDRGNAERMIKEHKCFLKSSRTSCTSATANQFRLFLHSAAYVVMHGLRDTALRGTEMATATFDTSRLRLLKGRCQSGEREDLRATPSVRPLPCGTRVREDRRDRGSRPRDVGRRAGCPGRCHNGGRG
jgi:hypothetical protein